MKKIFLLLILAIAIKITLGQDTIIKTPTGVSVPAKIETMVYSEGQVAYAYIYYENLIADSSWNATIIELDTLSAQYNCHGYAWHVSDGGNKVRIEGGPGPYIEDENASYIQTSSTKNLRKVYYNGGGHSAITTETSGIIISKWGWGPLVRHAVNDCPYLGYTLEYYEIEMSGATSVEKGSTANVSTTLDISGATYSWSGDGNYVCASGSTRNGSVTGLNVTSPYGEKGKAFVEITSPYSNTTVKGVRELTVQSQSKSPYITGPTLVCSTGGSFTLHDIPAGNSVTWESSSNLHTSNNTANPCTFTATGNGSGWVEATLSTSCSSGIIPVDQYPIWAGTPVFNSISGPYSTPNYQWATFYAEPNNPHAQATNYTWILNPLNGNSVYPYGRSVDIAFYNSGYYQLVVRAQNTCGTGPYYWRGVYVYDSYYLMISPNPATNETTLTIESDSDKNFDETAEWEMEIYSLTQILIEKKTKLKGQSTKIYTSSWKKGIYIVRVKYKDVLLNARLLVGKE